MNMKTDFSHIFISAVAFLLCSCSVTRDIPEGNYLLDDVKVVVDGKYRDINTGQLKNYVRQKGNSRWFSAVKLPLGVYALEGKDIIISKIAHGIPMGADIDYIDPLTLEIALSERSQIS